MPLKRSGSLHNFAVREATTVAAERKTSQQKSASASEYCKLAQEAIEFQILSLQAEQKILNEIADMDDGEKTSTVFQMLDKDSKGYVNALDMRKGLLNTHGTYEFERSISLAVDQVLPEEKGNEQITYKDFQDIVQQLQDQVECSLSDISQLLIVQVAFAATSKIVDTTMNPTMSMLDLSAMDEEEKNFEKLLIDQRMKMLFNLFDFEQTGGICFKEVVFGLYKITKGIDKVSQAAVTALLMFDNETRRELNFEGFTNLIINFLAASPDHVKFDDVADSMTAYAAEPMEMNIDEMGHLFCMDASLKTLLDLNSEETKVDNHYMSDAELGKLNQLFHLWDQDRDGFIDFHELALGIRKFQETTQLNTTVEETMQIMNAFDHDDDKKLNKKEFCEFIHQFFKMSGEPDIMNLIDFMIVAGAIKENSEQEKNYINSLRESDIYYWGY